MLVKLSFPVFISSISPCLFLSFSKFIQKYYLRVRFRYYVICSTSTSIIYVDNKIKRSVQLHKIHFNLHVPRIFEIGKNNVNIWIRNQRALIYIVSQQFLLKLEQNKFSDFEDCLRPYKRRKQHFPCNLFGGETYSVDISQYVGASCIPIQRSFHYCVVSL